MRLLLMPLISQAIYYAAGPGRGSSRRAELDAEKVSESPRKHGVRARGKEGELSFALIIVIILPPVLHLILQIKTEGNFFFFSFFLL